MQACHKLETSPLFIWILWSGWWLLFFLFWKRKKLLRSCRFLRHAISDILFFLLLFTSPDDEIHLDGPVEFDHVDGHHTFYPRAIFLSHFSMTGDAISCAIRWERACTVCQGGSAFYYIKKIWMFLISLSIYNVSLWWKQLSYSFKDVVYSFYYFYTMKKFSLFLEAYFLFLTGSDLLLIHFIWTLFGKQTSLINGTRTLSKCPAPVWGIFIVDSICDTCFWYKRCGRGAGGVNKVMACLCVDFDN